MEAASGAGGLELAGSASAMVLDVNLRDLHGYEVCRLVRADQDTRDLPVVHVSARPSTPDSLQLSKDAGAHAFLATPVDGEALAAMLDQLIAEAGNRVPGGRSGKGSGSVLDGLTRREKLRNGGEEK
jgi:CheY-like chemotaxis protein